MTSEASGIEAFEVADELTAISEAAAPPEPEVAEEAAEEVAAV